MSSEWSREGGVGIRQAWLEELKRSTHMYNLALLMVPLQNHVVHTLGNLVRQVSTGFPLSHALPSDWIWMSSPPYCPLDPILPSVRPLTGVHP